MTTALLIIIAIGVVIIASSRPPGSGRAVRPVFLWALLATLVIGGAVFALTIAFGK
jgi:hypothetical protein